MLQTNGRTDRDELKGLFCWTRNYTNSKLFADLNLKKKNTNMSSLIFDQANKVDTKSTITCFYLVLLKTLKATLFLLCFCAKNHPVGTLNFPKN